MRLAELLGLKYLSKIIWYDIDELSLYELVIDEIKKYGFKIIYYKNPEEFRFLYENELEKTDDKIFIIVKSDIKFLPYDIKNKFKVKNICLEDLVPKVIIEKNKGEYLDIEYLITCNNLWEIEYKMELDKEYINDIVYDFKNINNYISKIMTKINKMIVNNPSIEDWVYISKARARLIHIAFKRNIDLDLSVIDIYFERWVLKGGYKGLSNIIRDDFLPAILPQIMTRKRSEKLAIIVIDGMSMFDFYTIKPYLERYEFIFDGCFAIIPTTTAISRQALLSGKFPVELDNPFSLKLEKKEFFKAAINLGYKEDEIKLIRGYDLDRLLPTDKFIGIILNDIDDIVHGSTLGKKELMKDVDLFAMNGKLNNIIEKLFLLGFDIILTSDHGNTECRGMGQIKGAGVQIETRSNRMVIIDENMDVLDKVKENCIGYPGYYLPEGYRYFVCKNEESFDVRDTVVNTHGSLNIEEVIVPYVIFKEEDNV